MIDMSGSLIKMGVCSTMFWKKGCLKMLDRRIGHILPQNRSLTARFENQPYILHLLTEPPAAQTELLREDALLYYRQMSLVRAMEKAFRHLYQTKMVVGFCHVYTGQEACAVGICAIKRPQDSAITSYRCHGWALLMGEPLEQIFAELMGRKTGTCRGKGGSMHLYTKQFYGGHGIVGAHVPIGTGLALAHQYKKDGGLCFTVMGDGATNNGQVYEAFNLAKLQNLPIIYVIENNNYGMGTPAGRSSANTKYYTRGDLIPGIRTSGMDILTVREAARYAVEYVMNEKGPILLELMTYRFFGHSLSDPGTGYRSRDEIQDMRDNYDPINVFSSKIIAAELATEEELKVISKENRKEVDRCIEIATKSEEPGLEELVADVYADYKAEIRLPEPNIFIGHFNTSKKSYN